MNIVVMGRRHQGKSTLARFLGERIQSRVGAHTILAFDPKRTFRILPHTSDLAELEEMITDPRYNFVAYQPLGLEREPSEQDMAGEFDAFFRALGIEYHLGMGDESPRHNLSPVVLIVDEAWMLQQRGQINGSLAQLVRLADSENFYLIQAAHRPSDFNTATRAQIDEFFSFRQWLADDLDILQEWAGAEVAEKIAKLPPHHVIRFDIGSETWELWAKPEAWYLKNKEGDSSERNNGDTESVPDATGDDRNQQAETLARA